MQALHKTLLTISALMVSALIVSVLTVPVSASGLFTIVDNELTVTFASTLTDPLYHYVWDFGDGSSTTEDIGSTAHSYASEGVYTVTLTIYSEPSSSEWIISSDWWQVVTSDSDTIAVVETPSGPGYQGQETLTPTPTPSDDGSDGIPPLGVDGSSYTTLAREYFLPALVVLTIVLSVTLAIRHVRKKGSMKRRKQRRK